mmetsp:Transcript_11484/g.32567  ORF Transcript_11484/g.32567 Transcript_11484/m.32567 type:complete len:273 (+) Transcript_11484:190-1008(+)
MAQRQPAKTALAGLHQPGSVMESIPWKPPLQQIAWERGWVGRPCQEEGTVPSDPDRSAPGRVTSPHPPEKKRLGSSLDAVERVSSSYSHLPDQPWPPVLCRYRSQSLQWLTCMAQAGIGRCAGPPWRVLCMAQLLRKLGLSQCAPELCQEKVERRPAVWVPTCPTNGHVEHWAAIDLAGVLEAPDGLEWPHDGGGALNVVDQGYSVLSAVLASRYLLAKAALGIRQRHGPPAVSAKAGTWVAHRLLEPRAELTPEEPGTVLLARCGVRLLLA